MADELETLHELKRTVDRAIDRIAIRSVHPIRDEICDYTKEDFDFIIGNFGVKRIGGDVKMKPDDQSDDPCRPTYRQSRQQGSR